MLQRTSYKQIPTDSRSIVPMHDTLTDILYRYCCAAGLMGSPDAFVFGVPHSNNAIPAVGAKYRFEKILGGVPE